MNHEVNTKTLYAIIAFAISIFTVCPFLGGAAKALSPTLVINVRFISGPCDSPLSSTFDKNVVVKHGVRCFLGAAVHLVKLRPGETGQVIGPGIGTTYQAAAPGMTVTTVTFHYQSDNGASASVTRSFEFNIV
jgi:hypothetical protein